MRTCVSCLLLLCLSVFPAFGQAVNANAETFWRNSRTLGTQQAMRARLRVMSWREGRQTVSAARIVQGTQGRYCLTYESPATIRGQVVCSDGTTHWHYAPQRNLLIRTPLTAEDDLTQQERDSLIERNYRLQLVSANETAAGRRVVVLALTPRTPGKGSQKRWIDRTTFKTLRIETRYADGSLAQVTAYDRITFPAHIAETELFPHVSETARIRRPAPADKTPPVRLIPAAQKAGLPVETASGLRLMQAAADNRNGKPGTYFLYSDGIEMLSVFVQAGHNAPPALTAPWRKTNRDGIAVYEMDRPHLAITLWTRSGRRYTMLSHLEPKAMQTLLHEFLTTPLPAN